MSEEVTSMSRFILKNEMNVKTFTYMVMHFLVAVGVTFVLTGNWVLALSIGTIEPLVQTVFFHIHERVWCRVTHNIHNTQNWQEWRDSNPQPSVLETDALPLSHTPI
jgi:uncharacterized membrane protein